MGGTRDPPSLVSAGTREGQATAPGYALTNDDMGMSFEQATKSVAWIKARKSKNEKKKKRVGIGEQEWEVEMLHGDAGDRTKRASQSARHEKGVTKSVQVESHRQN